MLERVLRIMTSVRLTVVLLALGVVLVLWGTLAQVHLGLYQAQSQFFRSFFVYWGPGDATWKVPVFPGGYLLGGLLLLNLLGAHTRYYQPGWRKSGIVMIHAGLVLLIGGQFLTDVLSTESLLHLRHGETKNYSEAGSEYELAIVDTTAPDADHVLAIAGRRLERGGELRHPDLPFTVRVKAYQPNSRVTDKATPGFEPATTNVWWQAQPRETASNRRDVPSGVVELGPAGTFFVSAFLSEAQAFHLDGRQYQVALRPVRYYKPYTLHLVEFRHDKYPGTDIPKNFSSRVRLERTDRGESREVLIFMNNPLRYAGETYYQASFDPDNQGTVLQVVRNPSWLTPYFACVLVGLGLTVQFAFHLLGFAAQRKTP